jgi:predicted transposase YdaD
MPYVTSIEQLGREEGRQEGRLTGRQEDILEALATRFGKVPAEVGERVQALQDEATLKRLLRQAVLAPSLEAFITDR